MEYTELLSDSSPENSPRSRASSDSSIYHVKCEHCHHETESRSRRDQKRRLLITSVFCVIFMIAEIVGGVMANSLAIATDAAHMLSDFAAFMVSLFSLWLATKPPTKHHSFGFYRAEILGALSSILLLWLLTGILVYMAIERIVRMDFELDATIMMVVAVVGIAVNIVMVGLLVMKCSIKNPFQMNLGINVKAAFLHVLGDLLQSVAVLVASVIVYVKPAYKIADPICTFLFSILILITTLKTMCDIIQVLMEGAPKGVNLDEIRQIILSVPGVVKVYNLRVWSLTLEKVALSAHVAVQRGTDPLAVLKNTTDALKESMKFFEMTLQIEQFSGDECTTCEGTSEIGSEV